RSRGPREVDQGLGGGRVVGADLLDVGLRMVNVHAGGRRGAGDIPARVPNVERRIRLPIELHQGEIRSDVAGDQGRAGLVLVDRAAGASAGAGLVVPVNHQRRRRRAWGLADLAV